MGKIQENTLKERNLDGICLLSFSNEDVKEWENLQNKL